jgi:hypothetical protein
MELDLSDPIANPVPEIGKDLQIAWTDPAGSRPARNEAEGRQDPVRGETRWRSRRDEARGIPLSRAHASLSDSSRLDFRHDHKASGSVPRSIRHPPRWFVEE